MQIPVYDYSHECAVQVYNEYNRSGEERNAVVEDERHGIYLRAGNSERRLRTGEVVTTGGLALVVWFDVPTFHQAKAARSREREAQGFTRATWLNQGWTERKFTMRLATMHRKAIRLKALRDMRRVVYVALGDARRAVGQRRLAKWSKAILKEGLISTDEFSEMTADDCLYWLGWCRGIALGASTKQHKRVAGSDGPMEPGVQPSKWESSESV